MVKQMVRTTSIFQPRALGCWAAAEPASVLNDGKIAAETVWNDGSKGGATGGGVSQHFSKPAYQASVKVPTPIDSNPTGRGVPDVAGNADPATGYVVLIGGQEEVVGGTSAVAPLWAGLIALLNEQIGKRVGWLNPKLYTKLAPGKALRDITVGNNGDFQPVLVGIHALAWARLTERRFSNCFALE